MWNYVEAVIYYNEEVLETESYGEDSIRKTSKISELVRTDGGFVP